MSWEEKALKEMGTALAKINIRSAVSSDLDQITHALREAAEKRRAIQTSARP